MPVEPKQFKFLEPFLALLAVVKKKDSYSVKNNNKIMTIRNNGSFFYYFSYIFFTKIAVIVFFFHSLVCYQLIVLVRVVLIFIQFYLNRRAEFVKNSGRFQPRYKPVSRPALK